MGEVSNMSTLLCEKEIFKLNLSLYFTFIHTKNEKKNSPVNAKKILAYSFSLFHVNPYRENTVLQMLPRGESGSEMNQ